MMLSIRATARVALAAVLMTIGSPALQAGETARAPGEEELLARLREAFPASRIDAVSTTQIEGVFEVVAGPNVFYSDPSGRYLMFGKLYDMNTRTDITAMRIAEVQRLDVSILPHANAIKQVRGAGERTLYVFADPNCSHCKALEKTLQTVDNVTIFVYLVPLLGPDSFDKARAIWCAPDRAKAWSDWMLRGSPPRPQAGACDDPIDMNAELSRKLDMAGTPMLIGVDGRRLMGAVHASAVEALLAKSSAVAAAGSTKTPR